MEQAQREARSAVEREVVADAEMVFSSSSEEDDNVDASGTSMRP